MAHVKLEGVRKVYEDGPHHVAVHGADLEVGDGEFVVLVGPSGSGKSTLLRMIAGLESITGGRLLIGDRVVNDMPPKERDIAMVFQNYALYPHMTVRENMAFGLKLRKLPAAEIDQRVREAARILGIEEILDRRPRQLSGGQRQRVAVGRAIVRKPQVFLFDEPLSNLDAKLRVQTRREITRLHRQLAATMIYVTHDQVEAMTMGDRIVVMSDGRVQQIDTPINLYERPLNRFVAGFIGSPAMNFFSGQLSGSRFVAEGGTFELPLPADRVRQLGGADGRRVVLGVRPEHVAVAGEGAAPGPSGAIPFALDLVEPMGNETFLHAHRDPHDVTARIDPRPLPPPGSTVHLVFDARRVHLFDAETEERLGSPE